MNNFSFRLFILLNLLDFGNFGFIAKRKPTKMYLIEVDERKPRNHIDRGKISRDYKSKDDGHDRFYKKSKRGDDGFLNKMRKELGIVKGFFRTSSSTKEGNEL